LYHDNVISKAKEKIAVMLLLIRNTPSNNNYYQTLMLPLTVADEVINVNAVLDIEKCY
jgi:hypothetical protein